MSVIGPSRRAFKGPRAHTAMARYARASASGVPPSHEGIQSAAGRYARSSQFRRRQTAQGKRMVGYATAGAIGYSGYQAYQHRGEIRAKAAQLHQGIHNAFHKTRTSIGA